MAAGTSGDWDKIYVNTDTIPFLNAQSEEYWLVDPSVLPKPVSTPDQPETPETPETPGPNTPGGGETPGTPLPPEEVVKAFKSLKAVRDASVSQLELVVPKNTARAVYDYFHAQEAESPCASSPALPEAED